MARCTLTVLVFIGCSRHAAAAHKGQKIFVFQGEFFVDQSYWFYPNEWWAPESNLMSRASAAGQAVMVSGHQYVILRRCGCNPWWRRHRGEHAESGIIAVSARSAPALAIWPSIMTCTCSTPQSPVISAADCTGGCDAASQQSEQAGWRGGDAKPWFFSVL
jgi:hypothetical protein